MLVTEHTSDTERVTWSLRKDKKHKVKIMTETLVDGKWVQLALKGRDFSQSNPHEEYLPYDPKIDGIDGRQTDNTGYSFRVNPLWDEWEESRDAVADLTGVAAFVIFAIAAMIILTAISMVF